MAFHQAPNDFLQHSPPSIPSDEASISNPFFFIIILTGLFLFIVISIFSISYNYHQDKARRYEYIHEKVFQQRDSIEQNYNDTKENLHARMKSTIFSSAEGAPLLRRQAQNHTYGAMMKADDEVCGEVDAEGKLREKEIRDKYSKIIAVLDKYYTDAMGRLDEVEREVKERREELDFQRWREAKRKREWRKLWQARWRLR